ncbi:MAG TPA: S4 domain-containing protein, partial [Thermodesulfobacteriota bacterium]|nr:S4 domain-containing protein [Thermodesulfobacteriota bacterium]
MRKNFEFEPSEFVCYLALGIWCLHGMTNLSEDSNAGKSFSILVSEKHQGRRLDQFLSQTPLNLSRSQAKNLIEKHLIFLNQKQTKPSAHVKTGDRVSGSLPGPEP